MPETLVDKKPQAGDQIAYQTEIMARANINPRLAVVVEDLGAGYRLDDEELLPANAWIRVVVETEETEEKETMPPKKKTLICARCGVEFTKTGSRDKYCVPCRAIRQKEHKAAWDAKQRAKKAAAKPTPPEQVASAPALPAASTPLLMKLNRAFMQFGKELQDAGETFDKANELLAILEREAS